MISPEKFIFDILASGKPRFKTMASAFAILKHAHVTGNEIETNPNSAREKIRSAIDYLEPRGALAVSPEWQQPLDEFYRMHPERRMGATPDILESYCDSHDLPWELSSFLLCHADPNTPLGFTMEYSRQQNELEAFTAQVEKEQREAEELREKFFQSFAVTAKARFGDNRYMHEKVLKDERKRLEGLSYEQLVEIQKKKDAVAALRSVPVRTPEERERQREFVGSNVNRYPELPRTLVFQDTREVFEVTGRNLKNLANTNRHAFRALLTRYGSSQLIARMQESA